MKILVSDYVPEQYLEMVATCEKSDLGRILLTACRRRADRILNDVRKNPKMSPEKIPEGIRYKLGQADEVEFVSELVKECQRELTNSPGGAGE